MNKANIEDMISSGRDKIFFKMIVFSGLELEFKSKSDCVIFMQRISYMKLTTIENSAIKRPGEIVKSGSFNEKIYKPNKTIMKDKRF